jgi:hypothetical protein
MRAIARYRKDVCHHHFVATQPFVPEPQETRAPLNIG